MLETFYLITSCRDNESSPKNLMFLNSSLNLIGTCSLRDAEELPEGMRCMGWITRITGLGRNRERPLEAACWIQEQLSRTNGVGVSPGHRRASGARGLCSHIAPHAQKGCMPGLMLLSSRNS